MQNPCNFHATKGTETRWGDQATAENPATAPNVVTDLQVVGDAGGTEIGGRRVLNGAFHETLRVLDDGDRTLRYTTDDGPGPMAAGNVSGYVGEVRVLPVTVGADGDQSVVVWRSDWVSEAGDGGPVADFCDPICKALMGDLKAHFG